MYVYEFIYLKKKNHGEGSNPAMCSSWNKVG